MARPGPGDLVRIRDQRWRIVSEARCDAIWLVDVYGCDGTNRGVKARFIAPHEAITAIHTTPPVRPRFVVHRRWRRSARAALAATTPHYASLRAAARANLNIIPFQLEPALAITRGDACRILIADEVGLGKTIQAGLIVAETLTRTPDARALVVSPAGLCEQWREELRSRFSLPAEILDAGGLARTTGRVAPGANPWTIHPVAITSIDFVKRPDVMRSLDALVWDVVVLDEAHALAGRSDRAAAAAGLAKRARSLVMLTATPHSGDEVAFARLSNLGDLAGMFPLLIFRRSRVEVGLPHGRRTTQLHVRQDPTETAMHETLSAYLALVQQQSRALTSRRAVELVAAILTRRACSSATSLSRSLVRREDCLAREEVQSRGQLSLPLEPRDDDEEPDAELLSIAGLSDVTEEREWLERIRVLADAVASRESKIRALRRLLARARQPALVFTEYRDTLQHVAAALADFEPVQLHGGLTASDRRHALQRFCEGNADLLLATDAASEGLNLHHRCRLVVNLDLPWTPTRLEQRIGRLDRLGQPKRVHAVQLIAAGSAEEQLAERIASRAQRIGTALGATTSSGDNAGNAVSREAKVEASRLQLVRTLAGPQSSRISDRPFVAISTQRSAARGATWALSASCTDSTGYLIFETVIGLHDRRGRLVFDELLEAAATQGHQQLLSVLSSSLSSHLRLMTDRETAILDCVCAECARLSAGLLQPGLFDRRIQRMAAAQAAILDEARHRSDARLADLTRMRELHAGARALLFGIVTR